MVSADNLLLKETFLGSRSYENLQADSQSSNIQGEMILGRPERRDDNK